MKDKKKSRTIGLTMPIVAPKDISGSRSISSGRRASMRGAPPAPSAPAEVIPEYTFPTAGQMWDTAIPEEVDMDPTALDTAINGLFSGSLVIRRGYLVGYRGTESNITTPGPLYSVCKSLVSLILARLVYLNQITLSTTVPGSDNPSTPLATYSQLANMLGDYGLDDVSTPHSPGDHYAYNNAGVNLYADYIQDTYFSGSTEVEMLQEAYVTALGFQNSLTFAGFLSGWDQGFSMSAVDLARIAYLVLRNGIWNGTRLLSSSYMTSLWTNQIPAEATEQMDRPGNFYNEYAGATPQLPGAYSYGFWHAHNCTIMRNAATATETLAMNGAFGNSVFISREKELIVVCVYGYDINSGTQFDAVLNACTD